MSPILSVRNMSVEFRIDTNRKYPWTPPQFLQAVRNLSFDLGRGKTLGIVGESGCGKSTLARAIVRLVKPKSGEIFFQDRDIANLNPVELRAMRKDMQMIFQDPMSSLNPRMTIGDIIAEPLREFKPQMTKAEREKSVLKLLDRVGILANNINRYPHEFSGGQCQRIGIARALIVEPKLLICDEPVSALDVSVQAQVINLLRDLQNEMGLSMMFVAHDVSVVRHVSDQILVMYLGEAVEYQSADDLIKHPKHPYTKALLSAVPVADPNVTVQPQLLVGDLPSPLNLPIGCAFSTRCPIADERCKNERPKFIKNGTAGVSCFKA